MASSAADRLRRLRFLPAALLLCTGAPSASALETPAAEEILAHLSPAHPRLLATAADFARLKQLTADGEAQKWFASIRGGADDLLQAPPSKYEIPDGKRLLATSRRVLDRTLALGLTFRLTGEQRYAARLWQELATAADFTDWNPRHFLDTAEMTAAFAIGYDWLFEEWTPEQKRILREAIIGKGLQQSLKLYRGRTGWTQVRHNWNQVCNGGMTLGALAVAEDEKALSGEILAAAVASVPKAMREFAPDGAWGEGPGYWDYAVMYNVFMLAALDTAMGTDFGLSKMDGFARAADFPVQATGPFGRTFNYADAGDGGCGGPHILWLAGEFSRPDHAAWRLERSRRKPSPLDLIYGARWLAQPPKARDAPVAKYFRGPETVMLRSAWNDPQAAWVGFKAGDNRVNHGHLDLGSFVFDAAGERWAADPGADDYNLPGYFGKARWDYYRLRAEGHNTLVISPDAGPDQEPSASAKIIRFSDKAGDSFAIADLTPAYARKARSVQRGVRLTGRNLLVQDEFMDAASPDIYWFLHTAATIECHDATATFTQNGKTLTATLLSPSDAKFTVRDALPLPTSPNPEGQMKKHASGKPSKKLTVQPPAGSAIRIAVLLSPDQPSAAEKVEPLAEWK